MMETSWFELIGEEMKIHKETWDDVVDTTLEEEDLCRNFDSGYGGSEGCSFTLWTEKRVYFPAVYDGSEWVESISRDPDGEPTMHIGGQ